MQKKIIHEFSGTKFTTFLEVFGILVLLAAAIMGIVFANQEIPYTYGRGTYTEFNVWIMIAFWVGGIFTFLGCHTFYTILLNQESIIKNQALIMENINGLTEASESKDGMEK